MKDAVGRREREERRFKTQLKYRERDKSRETDGHGREIEERTKTVGHIETVWLTEHSRKKQTDHMKLKHS